MIQPRPMTGGCAGFLQFGAPGSEAEEDEAEESFWTGKIVFRHGKVGRRLCLLGSVPKALFQGGVGSVFFRWCNPDHGKPGRALEVWLRPGDRRMPRPL